MRRAALVILLAGLLGSALLVVTGAVASSSVSAGQLAARFRAATGDRLVVDKRVSYPGHYVALGAVVQSITTTARYGTFSIRVVTASDVEKEVTGLLADSHTGVLGEPGPGTIFWEQGRLLGGGTYWMAKRRYGANVVLTWIGNTRARKTDATWTRLHRALTAATR